MTAPVSPREIDRVALLQPLREHLASLQEQNFSAVAEYVGHWKSTTGSKSELQRAADELRCGAQRPFTSRATGSAQSSYESENSGSKEEGPPVTQARTGAQEGEEPASASASGDANSGSGASAGGSDRFGGGATDRSEEASSSQGRSQEASSRKSVASRVAGVLQSIRREVEEAVFPRQEAFSATRARDPNIRPAGSPGSSALSVAKQQESRWQKQWSEMQDKFGAHPIFQRLKGFSDNRVFNRGREVADDLRERWETSDSPLVQRIQDMRDSISTETEQAQALREIRSRYPEFDMVRFVRVLKGDVPVVIKAYLEGDLVTLTQHCSAEMMERFSGIIAAQRAEGLTTDSTILDVSDVELVDLKFVERNPVVVVQFTCQQINCARDKFGNVVEGGPQDVQRVYYYWALQQEDAGFVGEDGKFHPPRWQLREMMVRGMHNLL